MTPRRLFLHGLGVAVGMALLSMLMFHKVDDSPRFPEDISTTPEPF